MLISKKNPIKIKKGSLSAHSAFLGEKRVWGEDPNDGDIYYEYNLIDDVNNSSWVNLFGRGNSLFAVTFCNPSANFGGVTWQQTASAVEMYASNGTYWIGYLNNGSWAFQNANNGFSPSVGLPSITRGGAWSPDNIFEIVITGLTIGNRYGVQFVIADTRNIIPARTFEIVPNGGTRGSDNSVKTRFAYQNEGKYLVATAIFTATASEARFYPRTYDPDNTSVGTQLNAINLISLPVAKGKTYYISNSGSDNNDGMGRATPWATLNKVNSKTFQAGDKVLFERGGSWTGTLSPKGNGTPDKRIVLGAYSDGPPPLIDGAGAAQAIFLQDQNYWEIRDFDITNWSDTDDYRYGILINNDASGELLGITIKNCFIHKIRGGRNPTGELIGKITGRHTGAIQVLNRSLNAYSDDILIENNYIEDIIGLAVQVWTIAESQKLETDIYGATNVIIRGNTINRTSCESIICYGTNNEIIEKNHCAYNAFYGLYESGFFVANCYSTRHTNGIQRYNHVHDSLVWAGVPQYEGYDNQALGIDFHSYGEEFTMAYNYTHDNEGGFCIDTMSEGEGETRENSVRVTSKFNISINEPRINASRYCTYFNNLFFCPTDRYSLHWCVDENVYFYNNIFVCSDTDDGFDNQVYSNNIWHGLDAKPIPDTDGVIINPSFSKDPAFTIFKDHYITSNPTSDINSDKDRNDDLGPRRHLGFLRGSTYSVFGTSPQITMGENWVLQLGTSGPHATFAFNPNIASIYLPNPITIRILTKNISASDPTNWMSFMFKNSPFSSDQMLTNSGVDFGFLIRENGQAQAFAKGVQQTNPLNWVGELNTKEYHCMEFVFSDISGTQSAFNANGTVVSVYSNGLLLGSYEVDQMNNLYFSYGMIGSSWWVKSLFIRSGDRSLKTYKEFYDLVLSEGSPAINSGNIGEYTIIQNKFEFALDSLILPINDYGAFEGANDLSNNFVHFLTTLTYYQFGPDEVLNYGLAPNSTNCLKVNGQVLRGLASQFVASQYQFPTDNYQLSIYASKEDHVGGQTMTIFNYDGIRVYIHTNGTFQAEVRGQVIGSFDSGAADAVGLMIRKVNGEISFWRSAAGQAFWRKVGNSSFAIAGNSFSSFALFHDPTSLQGSNIFVGPVDQFQLQTISYLEGQNQENSEKDFFQYLDTTTINIGPSTLPLITTYKNTQIPSFMEVSGRFKIKIPTSDFIYYNFEVIVRDEYFRMMDEQNIEWSVYPESTDYYIDPQTGILEVSSSATPKRIGIKARCGGIIKRFPCSLVSS